MFLLPIHAVFLVLSIVLILFKEEGPHVVIFALFAACIELYLWAHREKNRLSTTNWCHPVPVFVLGYIIIYYQLPFIYYFGYELSYYSSKVIFYPQYISYCVLLASMGLSSFFCGEQVLSQRWYRKRHLIHSRGVVVNNLPAIFSRLNNVKVVFLLLTLVVFILYLSSIGYDSYFGYSYGDASRQRVASTKYLEIVYTLLLYLVILIEVNSVILRRPNSIRNYLRAWDKRVLALVAFILIPALFSGDRDVYLQSLALITAPYFILVKPLKFKYAIIAVIILSFAMALVGDTRGKSFVNWSQAIESRVNNLNNPSNWPTLELASSFGTFNIAVGYFPDKYDYNYGQNILYNLASIVPFSSVFTEVAKRNAENNYIFSSSLFFTNIITEGSFSSGSATSSLGDAYIDFGPYGIPFILFLWGLFMAWISKHAVTTFSPIFVFLYAYYSYYGIYVNRSSFFFGWNIFLWVIIAFYLIKRLYLDKLVAKGYSE